MTFCPEIYMCKKSRRILFIRSHIQFEIIPISLVFVCDMVYSLLYAIYVFMPDTVDILCYLVMLCSDQDQYDQGNFSIICLHSVSLKL